MPSPQGVWGDVVALCLVSCAIRLFRCRISRRLMVRFCCVSAWTRSRSGNYVIIQVNIITSKVVLHKIYFIYYKIQDTQQKD